MFTMANDNVAYENNVVENSETSSLSKPTY